MQLMVREKGFYRTVAAITVPIALQNLLGFSVSMADTVMLGMLGEVQLSAAAIANHLGFVFMLLSFGLGSGSSVLIAQFWGKGELDPIRAAVTVMYRAIICGSLVFTSLALFLPSQIVGIFTTDPLVIADAVKFLRIVGCSYLFMGLTTTTVTMLRAVRAVRVSIVVYGCSLVTNALLNYMLIFGNWGAPRLEIAGAAYATCTARLVEFLIAAGYLFFFEKRILYRPAMLFARKLGILSNYLRNSLPVVCNELLWGSGTAVIQIVIGRMGREFVAAASICNVLGQLVTVTLFGVANASAVIIGNTVGAGEYAKAKLYAKTLIVLSGGLGLVSTVFVLLLKGPMLMLYNISDTARVYADQIMTIYAFIVVFIAIACTLIIGVLRGGGDTRFALLIDAFFLWCVGVPLGFFAAFVLHWPVWAVYIVIKSDEILKTIFSLLRVASGRWINDVTKT